MRLLCVWILIGTLPLSVAAADHSWEVLATGLPETIGVSGARGNITYYILKQTHEPVFRKSDGQNYTSKILRDWNRTPDYRGFRFCPAPGLKYDQNNAFLFEDFCAHIASTTAKYDSSFRFTAENDCVNLTFPTPRKGYLDYLTLYENAPTKLISGRAEAGLGPYSVESVSKEIVVLRRKSAVRDGYNRIVLHEYSGPKDPNLENRAIKDFNIIPSGDIPKWVKDEYTHFENVELKSINLIINHPDRKVREKVYNCVDIPALRPAFFTGKKDFFDIGNILPMGITGASPGRPAQSCDNPTRTNTELRFANWMFGNTEAMAEFAAGFTKKSGIKLRVDRYSPQALVSVLNKSPRPFDLVIIVFDAVRPDPTAFFDSFAKWDGFHDFVLPEVPVLYKKLFYEEDETEKEDPPAPED